MIEVYGDTSILSVFGSLYLAIRRNYRLFEEAARCSYEIIDININ